MYRFKTSPQELPELVIDALNLFGHGIREVWKWALLISLFSLIGPHVVFRSIELVYGEIHTSVRWWAIFLSFILTFPGSFCAGMIIRRLFLLGTGRIDAESIPVSMQLVLRKLPSIYLALFLISFVSILGWLVIFVPGIFLGVAFAFVVPLILLDDCSIVDAFKESWVLVWGNWWRIFAMLFIPLMILAMISMLPVFESPILTVVVHTFVMWFDIPLLLTFMLTMFYDTKLRHEMPLHLPVDNADDQAKSKKKKKKDVNKDQGVVDEDASL